MSTLRFDLHSAGVLAPGMGSLEDLRAACRSGRPPQATEALVLPSPALLPANERRRSSQVVRLALACIEQALQASPFPVEELHSVFATDEGTGAVCQQVLESLATTRQISPLLFTNSVHNAPSGYFSIALRNRQSATVVGLGLDSFACGLLCAASEATVTNKPLLLVCYDPAMTEPLDEILDVTDPTATAWVLSSPAARAQEPALGSFEIDLAPTGKVAPTAMPGWLQPRWNNNSSARALAALGLLEGGADAVYCAPLGSQLLSLRRVAKVLA